MILLWNKQVEMLTYLLATDKKVVAISTFDRLRNSHDLRISVNVH